MTPEVYTLAEVASICEGAECQGCPDCPEWDAPPAVDLIQAKGDWILSEIRDKEGADRFAEYGEILMVNDDWTVSVDTSRAGPINTKLSAQGDGLDAFTESFDFEIDGAKLPALVQRTDGETVLYAGKLNDAHGLPGSGKSWVAIIAAHEAVLRGGNVIYWDFEDTRQTFKRRALMLGFDPLTHAENFKYLRGEVQASPAAVLEAQIWLQKAMDPQYSLVVIDAAESAGCPADGANVVPWYQSHVDPWLNAGAGVLLIDHIPKRQEDRPRGPIGSNHKLAKVNGVSLKVSGIPWTKKVGGKIELFNEKDRGGDMPAPVSKCVAVIKGTWQGDGDSRTFGYTIEAPEGGEDTGDLSTLLLQAVAEAGPDGITGAHNLIKMVKGKTKDKLETLAVLVEAGLLEKARVGKSDLFTATMTGIKTLVGLD